MLPSTFTTCTLISFSARNDQDAAAERAVRAGEGLGGRLALQRVDLVDLESQRVRRYAVRRELRFDEGDERLVLERLAREVDREAGDARAARHMLQGVPDHPAVEQRHHAEVLEHRQELPRRQQRLLLFPHADQDLGHRVAGLAGKPADRLAVERELVLLDRLAQPPGRMRPSRELGCGLLENVFVHAGILAR
jgi:hypothetical protein